MSDAAVIAAIAFISYYISTITGIGYGTLITPLLVILGLDIRIVVPSVIASQLVSNIVVSVLNHKIGNINLKNNRNEFMLLISISLAGGVGAFLSVFLFVNIPEEIIGLYLSIVLVILGVVLLIVKDKQVINGNVNHRGLIFLSLVASLNKGITGGGLSPIFTVGQLLLGINPRRAVSFTPIAGIVSEGVMFLSYLDAGLYSGSHATTIYLLIGSLAAVPFIVFKIKKSSNKQLLLYISISMIILGTSLLVTRYLNIIT